MRFFQIIFILLLVCTKQTGYGQIIKTDASILSTLETRNLPAQQTEFNAPLATRHKCDSIKQLINGSPDDTLKALRMLAVASLQLNNEKIAKDFATGALSLAEKLQFKHGMTMAYNIIGSIYNIRQDFKTAVRYYQLSIDVSETGVYDVYSAHSYAALLNIYFLHGDYPHAMETISREMELAEKNNDKRRIAHCNNILGYIYFKQENFKEAEKYYGLYINNTKQLNDSALLAHALGEVADVFIHEKKYAQAINSLSITLQICDRYLTNPATKKLGSTLGWAPQYKAKAMYRLGKVYKLTGELPKALHYSLEAVKFNTTNKYENASYYINAGDVYKKLKKFEKAISFLRYGFVLSRDIQNRENTRDAAEYLSQTYALQHHYDSAFYYYEIFTRLKDSIVNNETKIKIAGIQGQYDIAKKDKEITRQQQIRNIIIGSFIFLLIALLLLYNGYRLKQKNKNQQQQNQQQNELFNAIVTTQDQERKRIAKDIHDSLGSVLSAAKLKLSLLQESENPLSPDQQENYRTVLGLLDEASTELRNISHNIMPATLSKLGIVAALQNLINKLSTQSLQISFTAHGFEERIEETTEISVYRIILELINNIVKHAQADKVSLQLIKYPDYINLIVEDNGRGFSYDKAAEEKKGIGLGNILSRIEYLKGTIEFDSSPGKGTTIIIEIPCLNTNNLV